MAMGNIRKTWKVCEVKGYITAVDPGRLYTTGSHKSYMKHELYKGMNLCEYNDDLPVVRLKQVTDEYIVINTGGPDQKLVVGERIETPRHGLSYAYSDATIRLKTMTDEEVTQTLHHIVDLFDEMVKNYDELGEPWRNIPLGKEAFELMQEIPDYIEDEFDTPEDKGKVMATIASYMEETLTPRLCLEISEYIKILNPKDEDNTLTMGQLQDFINTDLPMEEYCRKYERCLKFDPVERTEKWEKVIYDVEKECAEILKEEPKGMGFCFSYWSTKASVLRKRGIEWRSPASMNPGVMFD